MRGITCAQESVKIAAADRDGGRASRLDGASPIKRENRAAAHRDGGGVEREDVKRAAAAHRDGGGIERGDGERVDPIDMAADRDGGGLVDCQVFRRPAFDQCHGRRRSRGGAGIHDVRVAADVLYVKPAVEGVVDDVVRRRETVVDDGVEPGGSGRGGKPCSRGSHCQHGGANHMEGRQGISLARSGPAGDATPSERSDLTNQKTPRIEGANTKATRTSG